MTISQIFIDNLRARVGLAEVISRRVKLTRRGREHVGLCPFHKEKTPSFTVNEEKGFYHCFGCGAHGGAIDFVMNSEGLSFPETIRRLAEGAGMDIPQDSPEERERDRHRKTLYDVMEAACVLFEKKLQSPAGANARAYLEKRGVTEQSIVRFRLGYAPDSRGFIKASLGREKISDELLLAAGLVIKPEDHSRDAYDRFRRRLIFPITDRRGRIIAFGGRLLSQGEPKYLNSPETALFHKGNILYGMPMAAAAGRKTSRLIVTEGYMDVIALSQAGLENTVAPLGTALGENQILELWKLVPELILCFDGDRAGRAAARAVAHRALGLIQAGRSLRIAILPSGEDPDTMIAAAGGSVMEKIISASEALSEFIWRTEYLAGPVATPEDKAGLEKRMYGLARNINDRLFRRYFIDEVGRRMWALKIFRRVGRGPTRVAPLPASSAFGKTPDPVLVNQQTLVLLLVGHPEIFSEIEESIGRISFADRELDWLRQAVMILLARPLTSAQLTAALDDRGRQIIAKLLAKPLFRRHRLLDPAAVPAEVIPACLDIIDDLRQKLFPSPTWEATQAGWEQMQATLKLRVGD